MILSDRDIIEALNVGSIKITPSLSPNQFQPASIDLRLGSTFMEIQEGVVIDVKESVEKYIKEYTDVQGIMISPHSFLLGSTKEKIELPRDIVARVEGRSSLARLGLMVHVTGGWVDPGYEGNLTLELYNVGPAELILYTGMRICQISFYRCGNVRKPYKGKYQGDKDTQFSQIYKEFA